MANPTLPADQELLITRIFEAPRELVFRAFSEAERLVQWWGPKGFEMGVSWLDFRPGGVFHYSMKAPNGMEMWGKFVYREIVPPEKIVFVNSFSDATGGLTRHFAWPEWPLEILNTLTFEEHQGKTTLTLRGGPINAPENEMQFFLEAKKGVNMGFNATFDQLETYLEAQYEIVVSREIAAPRERVFQAFLDPANIDQWWGPTGFRNETHSMEPKVGGVWRYTMHGPEGTIYPNQITYLEITPPERLVYDHGDFERVRFRSTLTFEDTEGKTRVTLRLRFPTPEERDAQLEFGAYEGGNQTLARLAAFVEGKEL